MRCTWTVRLSSLRSSLRQRLRRPYDLRHTFDPHYGHLARDGREHATALLDSLAGDEGAAAAWTFGGRRDGKREASDGLEPSTPLLTVEESRCGGASSEAASHRTLPGSRAVRMQQHGGPELPWLAPSNPEAVPRTCPQEIVIGREGGRCGGSGQRPNGSADDGIEVPLSRDALEFMRSAVFEPDARAGDEVFDGTGDEYLSRLGLRRDTRADVDGEPADLAVDQFALSGVQACADVDPQLAYGFSNSRSARDCSSRSVEDREEAVARCVHLSAAVSSELAADPFVVELNSSRPRRSPSSAALAVEPTMSVNSTVARTRSGSCVSLPRASRVAARNRLSSSKSRFWSPSDVTKSRPGSSTRRAPGIRSAM
jgi:hypothetical protein